MCEPQIPSLTEPRAESRSEVLCEIVVVLLLGVAPHLLQAIVFLLYRDAGVSRSAGHGSFILQTVVHTASAITIIAVMLWIMHKASPGWSSFGFKRFMPMDLLAPFGIYIVGYVAFLPVAVCVSTVMHYLGTDPNALAPMESGALAPPMTHLDVALVFPMSLTNATAEQLVITAYLVSRLPVVLGSRYRFLAPVIATLCFSSYHAYQGTIAIAYTLIYGSVFTWFFYRFRRILPCILAHTLLDIVPFVTAWLHYS